MLHGQQQYGAEKISTLASAARSVADDLDDVPHAQSYVEAVASQMDSLADYVARTDLEDMVEDGIDFAKRYPIATFAFAIAAGFGLVRLMGDQNRMRSESRSNSAGTRRASTSRRSTRGRKRSPGTNGNGKDTTSDMTQGGSHGH